MGEFSKRPTVSMSAAECLVERSVTSSQPVSAEDVANELAKLSVAEPVDAQKAAAKQRKAVASGGSNQRISPADFLNLQSLRVSALAHKTNTATRFGGSAGTPDLFATLLGKDAKAAAAAAAAARKDTADGEEAGLVRKSGSTSVDEPDEGAEELIDRGPVRVVRQSHHAAPYMHRPETARHDQENRHQPHIYYSSNAAYVHNLAAGHMGANELMNGCDGGRRDAGRLLQCGGAPNGHVSEVPNELPEALSDFILKYSRRYHEQQPSEYPQREPTRKCSSWSSSSSDSGADSPLVRPPSFEEGFECQLSPASAVGAPQSSPAAPRGAQTPTTPPKSPQSSPTLRTRAKRLSDSGETPARERLRAKFDDIELATAWAWMCKCTQSCPGALYFCDPDGDSLLHIVVWHQDYPKAYALVEQMLKLEQTAAFRKPYDAPNRMNETPLFLAVEKRSRSMVAYLLEAGGDPNFQTSRPERDAPLHYAAARGMTDIVRTLCSDTRIQLDMVNGMGLTPLLNAIKNHGVMEEERQAVVNNKPVIGALLQAGANPHATDAASGKSALHFAVERFDPQVIEIFRSHLSRDAMQKLVESECFSGETPLRLLQSTDSPAYDQDDRLRYQLHQALTL